MKRRLDKQDIHPEVVVKIARIEGKGKFSAKPKIICILGPCSQNTHIFHRRLPSYIFIVRYYASMRWKNVKVNEFVTV